MFQDFKLSWNLKFRYHASSPAQDGAGPKPSPRQLVLHWRRASREFSKEAQQPLQNGQDGEKPPKLSPISHLASTTTLGDRRYDYQWYFPA